MPVLAPEEVRASAPEVDPEEALQHARQVYALQPGIVSAQARDDAVVALKTLEREYLAARKEVVQTLSAATDALEAANSLRQRYVAAYATIRRLLPARDFEQFGITPQVEPGRLPGDTDPRGLRVRFQRIVGARW